jgi:hypothetical protein
MWPDTYIQKHHRHDDRSVKLPPITGPILEKRPKRLTTPPRNNGRFSRVQTYVNMPNAPCKRPAAPMPAMALPVMKDGEDGATAQRIDPPACILG